VTQDFEDREETKRALAKVDSLFAQGIALALWAGLALIVWFTYIQPVLAFVKVLWNNA
jgi:hypothetical protein